MNPWDLLLVKQDVEVSSKSLQLPAEVVCFGVERSTAAWWAGESQAVENPDPDGIDISLLCHENHEILNESGIKKVSCLSDWDRNRNDNGDLSTAFGLADLDSLALGTPPEFEPGVSFICHRFSFYYIC